MARARTRRWLAAHDAELRSVRTAAELTDLIRVYDAEVTGRAWEAREAREAGRRRHVAARRTERVQALRAAAAAADPGPVSTPEAGRRWARLGVLPRPVYHATRFGPQVLATGLRSRFQLAVGAKETARPRPVGLGGGPDEYVSVTPSRVLALRLAAALQAINEAFKDPEGVSAWFREHWLPWVYRSRVWREKHYSGDRPGPEFVRRVLNDASQVVFGKPWAPPQVHVPWIMGGQYPVPASSISVVTAYVQADQFVSSSWKATDRTWGLVVDAPAMLRPDCPRVRGGPRTNIVDAVRPAEYAPLLPAAVATATENPFEGNEIRACPEDVTVVSFQPVLNWRRILMPRSGSASRHSPGHSPGYCEVPWLASGGRNVTAKVPAALAEPGVDPFQEQRRRCVLAVYNRLVASGEPEGRQTTSRAFAICTKQLQRYGYIVPGTARPTQKGMARSLEKLAGPQAAERRAAYEQVLRTARQGRPSLKERQQARRKLDALLAQAQKESAKVIPLPTGIDRLLREAKRAAKRRTSRRGAAARW
jgi:hypothetical protein